MLYFSKAIFSTLEGHFWQFKNLVIYVIFSRLIIFYSNFSMLFEFLAKFPPLEQHWHYFEVILAVMEKHDYMTFIHVDQLKKDSHSYSLMAVIMYFNSCQDWADAYILVFEMLKILIFSKRMHCFCIVSMMTSLPDMPVQECRIFFEKKNVFFHGNFAMGLSRWVLGVG